MGCEGRRVRWGTGLTIEEMDTTRGDPAIRGTLSAIDDHGGARGRSPERPALRLHRPCLHHKPYSYRKAIIGSTCDARSAGMKPAASETAVSATADTPSTIGSQLFN